MSQKYNAVIFAAGEIKNIEYSRSCCDYVIAADRGCLAASEFGIDPERVIGDFDSLGYVPKHKELTVLPVEKDDTDTAYAVKCALGMSLKRIFILGGLGGRLDHTIANIQMLTYIARENGIGFLVNDNEALFVIRNREVTLHGSIGQPVTVFSLSDRSIGVYERGFKYTLEDAVLDTGFPLGVSNELAKESASISVECGELLVYVRGDMCSFIEKNRLTDGEVHQNLNIYF